MTAELFSSFHHVGIRFVDHFVVSNAEAAPISRQEGLSVYTDMEDAFYHN